MEGLTFHHLLPLLLIAAAITGGVHCREQKRVLPLHELQWGERSSSHSSSPHFPSRTVKGAAILELKHHSHSSGLLTTSSEDDHSHLLLSDEARVSSLQSLIKGTTSGRTHARSSKAQIPLTSGVKLQTLNYIVTIALGGKKETVIVDTGSDLTWVQCKPCSLCYNQQDPILDPSASPSYNTIPCKSPTCNSLQSATGSAGNCGLDRSNCYYDLSYGDGSYTRGVLAREKIDLGNTTVKDFIFGCGRNNHGLFGGASGIMGLGRTQLSLISQTSAQFKGVFSYCLPSRVFNSSGSLVLGDDPSLYKNSTPVSYTRMITDSLRTPFYFLNLTGMNVGGVALQASGFSNGKILIDSGTVITRVVPSIYKALKVEFLKQFSDYPSAPSFSILDACFNLSSYEEVSVPTLKLGFEGGVEVNVDVTGILYFVKRDASQVCLAVTSLADEEEVGIIGNYQQKNLRVVYDTAGSKLGFAQEACGSS